MENDNKNDKLSVIGSSASRTASGATRSTSRTTSGTKTRITSRNTSRMENDSRNNIKYRRKRKYSRRRERDRWRMFWILLIPYVVILIIAAVIFLKYVDKCLIRYEESQSVYAMQQYFDIFEADIHKGEIPEDVDLSAFINEFDSEEMISAMYIREVASKKLSFAKAKDSYMTEHPEYVIYADDSEIGRVSFEGINGEVILGVLTVLDWKVDRATFECSFPTHGYSVEVPKGYRVFAGDKELGQEYVTGLSFDDYFQYTKDYADVGESVRYEVTGVSSDLVISALDPQGNPAALETVGENSYAIRIGEPGEIPEDKRQIVEKSTKEWSLFMTRDMPGDSYGFYNVAANLIAGSYYYDVAYNWAHGNDIGFTSDHTLEEPVFYEMNIDNYVKYSEKCFACHVVLSKRMHLNLTGQVVNDTIRSTIIYVLYDDTDDGVDNPHWAMADMIADTE